MASNDYNAIWFEQLMQQQRLIAQQQQLPREYLQAAQAQLAEQNRLGMQSCMRAHAELVDDKAGQPLPYTAEHAEALERALCGKAIESACRALAQPTMGERFAEFKARMLPAISGSPFVEYCFDCSVKNGPTLLARCTKIPVEGDHLGGWAVAWNEHAQAESVCSQMDWWALVLGRAILRGGK